MPVVQTGLMMLAVRVILGPASHADLGSISSSNLISHF